jgi:hypothetical protein
MKTRQDERDGVENELDDSVADGPARLVQANSTRSTEIRKEERDGIGNESDSNGVDSSVYITIDQLMEHSDVESKEESSTVDGPARSSEIRHGGRDNVGGYLDGCSIDSSSSSTKMQEGRDGVGKLNTNIVGPAHFIAVQGPFPWGKVTFFSEIPGFF